MANESYRKLITYAIMYFMQICVCLHCCFKNIFAMFSVNRAGGQLVYTKTECFPSDSDSVEVKVSAIDTPELLYVQLCANLERSVEYLVHY